VTLLLDTHTLLWFLRNDPLLSAAAKAVIEDPANRKLVSVASCWENRPACSSRERFQVIRSTCCPFRLPMPRQLKCCRYITKILSIDYSSLRQ
jgi:hypothetical protein